MIVMLFVLYGFTSLTYMKVFFVVHSGIDIETEASLEFKNIILGQPKH